MLKTPAHRPERTRRRARGYLLSAAACVLALALYAANVPENPPGFYIDESSVAYNAHLIAETGRDEHGRPFPLYFRAFGDYKNPVFVYALAALFRATGPSIEAARLLSATLGAAAALALGLLAFRVTGRAEASAFVALSALLTPWLYECSRLAFEVAAYPLATALLLLALWRASGKERWSAADVLRVAASLALVTYAYSTGRLFAPLAAAGLALFVTRRNLVRVIQTWAAYALALVPLFVYAARNPGAMSGRFSLVTYVRPESTAAEVAREFALHYLADMNPWRWLVTGEQNVRDHVQGEGALLFVTFALAASGLALVLRKPRRREAWWRFVLFGLAASVVPAALTVNDFPQLRLAALPVLLHALTIPALSWLLGDEEGGRARDDEHEASSDKHGASPGQAGAESDERGVDFAGRVAPRPRLRRRLVLYAAVALVLVQGAHFQWLFHSRAGERWYVFDARFPRKILEPALATNRSPIYLYDPPGRSGYVQAYWHGLLRGVEPSRFVRLHAGAKPPPGALVISTEYDCEDCRTLARGINFILYAAHPTELGVAHAPLRPEAMRAGISANALPGALRAGGRVTLDLVVRNFGVAPWPAVGEADGRFGVDVRGRWLHADGRAVAYEDGRARVPYDLEPGDAAGVSLTLTAPAEAGEYVLEVDVVQEGVAWFGAHGSKTLRARVSVAADARP